MPKVDLNAMEPVNATGYPAPFAAAVSGRWYRRLAGPCGVSTLAASHVVLQPGAWSSQRHWHESEDELVIILSGEAVLVENAGRTPLRAGDIASFPKGVADGHHLINESAQECVFVAVSAGPRSTVTYADIDLHLGDAGYTRKDGQPY